MVIISTSAVAEIIQAVSAPSISAVASCASAGATAKITLSVAAMPHAMRPLSLVMLSPWMLQRLQRVHVGLAGPDTHRLIDRGDEDLAVTDLAGLGGRNDGFDHGSHAIGRHRHFDADLRQEVHGVFGAAVDFGVSFLAAVARDLARSHALHAERDQRVAHVLELERLDDGDDQFHEFVPHERLLTISALWSKIKRLVHLIPLVPANAGTQPSALDSRFRGNERSFSARASLKLRHYRSRPRAHLSAR